MGRPRAKSLLCGSQQGRAQEQGKVSGRVESKVRGRGERQRKAEVRGMSES